MARRRTGALHGHMAKAVNALRDSLRLVDLVVEVADARLPQGSRNPRLAGHVERKPLLLVLNKADLADPETTLAWTSHLAAEGREAVALDARDRTQVRRLVPKIQELLARAGRRTGHRPLRLMVAGIPNMGKSTLINSLVGKRRAATGARPGITRGKQWIRLAGLELLDLPGILPPYLEGEEQRAALASIGAVGEEIYPAGDAVLWLIERLRRVAPGRMAALYGVEEEGPVLDVLAAVGRARGALQAGGEVDWERTAKIILKDFQSGRLGRVSLERPAAPGSDPTADAPWEDA